jgi:hypothetical protein
MQAIRQRILLVKTLGLPDNLISVSNLQQDPLADSLHLSNGASWTTGDTVARHGQHFIGAALEGGPNRPRADVALLGPLA